MELHLVASDDVFLSVFDRFKNPIAVLMTIEAVEISHQKVGCSVLYLRDAYSL